ncbi:MAG: hypothetical protein AAFU58_02165, partial [Pseudomonadota bacterium]
PCAQEKQMSALERAAKKLADEVDALAAKIEQSPQDRRKIDAEARHTLITARAAVSELDEAIAALHVLRQQAMAHND